MNLHSEALHNQATASGVAASLTRPLVQKLSGASLVSCKSGVTLPELQVWDPRGHWLQRPNSAARSAIGWFLPVGLRP